MGTVLVSEICGQAEAKPVYLCNEVSLFMKNGIVTVHDIALRHIRSSFREPGDWHEILFRKLMYLKAFKSADAIITVSGFQKESLIIIIPMVRNSSCRQWLAAL